MIIKKDKELLKGKNALAIKECENAILNMESKQALLEKIGFDAVINPKVLLENKGELPTNEIISLYSDVLYIL